MKDVNLRGSSTQETTPRIYSLAINDFICDIVFLHFYLVLISKREKLARHATLRD